MIIKKRQLFIDSPYILSKTETIQDPIELLKKAEQELQNAQQQADQIINNAQIKAREIVENAKKESQEILEKARKESLAVQNHIKATIQTLEKISEEFQKQLKSKIKDISTEITDILRILIKKISYREIEKIDYQKKIESILTKIVGMKNIKITMNASDFEKFPQLVEQFKSIGAEVIKSTTLKSGDIVIDTEIGVIDGTNQHVTEVMDQLLEEAFGHERSS